MQRKINQKGTVYYIIMYAREEIEKTSKQETVV